MTETLKAEDIKPIWQDLVQELIDVFEEPPDLQSILFLIGVQELGKGYQKFSKNEKQDLMHVGTCTILMGDGFYVSTGKDEEGWPQFESVNKIPALSLREQDLLLKRAVLRYFKKI